MKNTEEWLLNKIFIKLGNYIQKRYCKNVQSKIYALTKPHGTKYIQKLHWVQILCLSSITGHGNYPWKCFVTPVRFFFFFWRKVIFFICELLSIVDATWVIDGVMSLLPPNLCKPCTCCFSIRVYICITPLMFWRHFSSVSSIHSVFCNLSIFWFSGFPEILRGGV